MPKTKDAPDKEELGDEQKQSTSSKIGTFLKDNLTKGKQQINKSTRDFQRSTLGLGHKPNVVPPGEANIYGELRKVELGWHPVAGKNDLSLSPQDYRIVCLAPLSCL